MANRIVLKQSTTPDAIPLLADLVVGELAINAVSGAVYTRSSGGAVLQLVPPGGAAATTHTHAATDLTSGTLHSDRVAGAYTGVTAVGTLTSLTVSGNVTFQGEVTPRVLALTWSSTLPVNWGGKDVARVTLTGDTTFTFSDAADGQKLLLELLQDGTGGHTVAWPGSVRIPTELLAANIGEDPGELSRVGFVYRSVSSTYDMVAIATGY
jgi:hypothetical protein